MHMYILTRNSQLFDIKKKAAFKAEIKQSADYSLWILCRRNPCRKVYLYFTFSLLFNLIYSKTKYSHE